MRGRHRGRVLGRSRLSGGVLMRRQSWLAHLALVGWVLLLLVAVPTPTKLTRFAALLGGVACAVYVIRSEGRSTPPASLPPGSAP